MRVVLFVADVLERKREPVREPATEERREEGWAWREWRVGGGANVGRGKLRYAAEGAPCCWLKLGCW